MANQAERARGLFPPCLSATAPQHIHDGFQRTLTALATCPRESTKIKSFSEMERTA